MDPAAKMTRSACRQLRRAMHVGIVSSALALVMAPAAMAQDPDKLAEQREQTRSEYESILEAMTLTDDRLQGLADAIAAVRKDTTAITAALVQTAKTERKLAEDISEIEERLAGLEDQEAGIKRSLHARRGVLAEVLGALQRMGLNPPPAILVKPEDAL